MDTSLSTSSPDRLEPYLQRDANQFTDSNSEQVITNAGIRQLVSHLSATLPYRSRRQSAQQINQITSALGHLKCKTLDPEIFQDLFQIISDCWLSMELEPVALTLLISAVNSLPKCDFLPNLSELAQNAFASEFVPVERVFILRILANFPNVAPALLAEACINAETTLDLPTINYAFSELWIPALSHENFNEELQLRLIASRLLHSSLAPVLLSSHLVDWLLRLSCISSEHWSAIGFHLQRLLKNPSAQVRESALECFSQLERVDHPDFAYIRFSTLMDSFSLNALGRSFRLPQIGLDHFWSMPSLALALKVKRASVSKVMPHDDYIICLDNIFNVQNVAELIEMRCLSIDAAATLIHDKLRTLGTTVSTMDDIIQRLSQNSISAESNVLVMAFLYSLHTYIIGINSQYPELQIPFPTAIPFFLSKRFIYDGFLEKIKPQRFRLAHSNPSAVQRSVIFSDFASDDLLSVAVPFCWALKQSNFLKMNINCISTALTPGSSASLLVDAIKHHSQGNYEAAIGYYFDAFQCVSPEHKEISTNGALQCIRSLQLWESVEELQPPKDGIFRKNICAANPIQKLLLDSSVMLHSGRTGEVQLMLDQNWSKLQISADLQFEPISMIIANCQLWINRIKCVQILPAELVSEAKEFISQVLNVSYLCSSYAETQELLAYHQLILSALDPSFNAEDYLSSPAFQNLPMLSELFLIQPSQKILSHLLLRAKETYNQGYVIRLLERAQSYVDGIIPELQHSILICSEPSESTLVDFWNLSRSSNQANITLSLIETMMRSPVHLLSGLFIDSGTSEVSDLVEQAFSHSQDICSGSHFARWCVDLAGILGNGWLSSACGPFSASSVEKLQSLLLDMLRAFICDEDQLKGIVRTICINISDELKRERALPTTKLFSILSSSLCMEIDWNHIADESPHLSQVNCLLSRIPNLLTRAAEMISDSLANRYSYDDALLLVALLDGGFFVENCRLPTSSWVDIIPQLQAMLRRTVLPTYLKSKVHETLLEIARSTPNFEPIAFPLTAPKLENSHLDELANDLKVCDISLWTDLCEFSDHMRKLSYFSDDKWLDLLSRLISEIPSRWRWWNEECEQGQSSAESYGQIMQSILDAFNSAAVEVSTNSECNRTRLFYEKFGHQIQTLWLHLCLPLQDTSTEIDKKSLLSTIIHQLKILKHDIHLLSKVDIRVVCPGISSPSQFTFRIPGMPAGSYAMTLANPIIEILKTKTRPRFISFIGSDGLTYSYLLKGKEDLNIDQRILQVVSYANDFMLKSAEAKSAGFSPIPTYSVTCLSSEAGLISIVPDTISLFRLNRFGAGSDRDSTGSQALDDHDHRDVAESTPGQVYLLYLHKVLEERKLSLKIPRSEWPPELFTELYDRLLAETDDTVLEKRLYLSSLSPEQEFLKKVLFTSTSAASSMLGYLLGIGDRHPGNILLRVETGEVVHIDFAVSFDAGRSLRVPETVPFRLTPCLRRALGPFSLPSGQFAHIMDLTYKRCRQNKPFILSILRALWNHPIEGWDPRRRRIMKRDVDRAMVHKLIVARLQRSRTFLESLHNWAFGNQSRWSELVATYNQWAVAHNELLLKTAEIAVLQHRKSAAEQAILILPDLLERQKEISSQLASMRGDAKELELKQKLAELVQQQASARDLINSLPQLQQDLKACQNAFAVIQCRTQVINPPDLTSTDSEIVLTLQNLWADIRSLISRICQDDFPVVQQLRSEWEQLQEHITAMQCHSTPSSGTLKLIEGRKTFTSFFATLKSFIKTDLPNLPSPDPRLRAASAISIVADKLSSSPDNLVQELINQAIDKENLSRMFPGWAPWV